MIAGDTAASIESFAFGVVHLDIDVVLIDQHFGLVLESKLGTDLVREIRALDLAEGKSRLVYIISANDTRADIENYLDAGADGERAHGELGAAVSAGDGFPMAVACAKVRNRYFKKSRLCVGTKGARRDAEAGLVGDRGDCAAGLAGRGSGQRGARLVLARLRPHGDFGGLRRGSR